MKWDVEAYSPERDWERNRGWLYDLFDSGLSNDEIRVLVCLEWIIDQKNWDHGDGPEWTNIVRGVSVAEIAETCRISEDRALVALHGLNTCGAVQTAWLSGPAENEIPGVCHTHRLASPTEQEISAQHANLARRAEENQKRLAEAREKKKSKQAKCNSA